MILRADARFIPLAAGSAQTVVTSPPYWGLRDYGLAGGGIGLERTLEEYVGAMVEVFREVRRVLKPDGTVWLNLGDSYSSGGRTTQVAPTLRTLNHDGASGKQGYLNNFAVRPGSPEGLKPKDLCMIPARVALALQADGWYLRSDIIWAKPNPMPESVTDRPTRSHEYLFLLSKSPSYFYDKDAIAERVAVYEIAETRNKRDVWTINSEPTPEAHFATFPQALVMPCILAGSRPGDLVLDPFGGSSTVGIVAERLGRRWATLELSAEYISIARRRTAQRGLFT